MLNGVKFLYFLREKKEKDDDGIFLWEEILSVSFGEDRRILKLRFKSITYKLERY